MNTAIFVDLAFVLKRLNHTHTDSPEEIGTKIYKMCTRHLSHEKGIRDQLYRIFIYDCEPLDKKLHYPVSHKALDLSKTSTYTFRKALHFYLIHQRKVALRMGRISDNARWVLTEKKMQEILKNPSAPLNLTDEDFRYETHQKGVDMKMGIDITSAVLKKQVNRSVLITGDADFVPAAKLARREGVDVILDPMWSNIPNDLFVHIDGLYSATKPEDVRDVTKKEKVKQTTC